MFSGGIEMKHLVENGLTFLLLFERFGERPPIGKCICIKVADQYNAFG